MRGWEITARCLAYGQKLVSRMGRKTSLMSRRPTISSSPSAHREGYAAAIGYKSLVSASEKLSEADRGLLRAQGRVSYE